MDDNGGVIVRLSGMGGPYPPGLQPPPPKKVTLYSSAKNPNTLVLVNQWSVRDQEYAATLRTKFKPVMQGDPSFHPVVLFAPQGKTQPKKLRLKIRQWMYSSVTNFYISSHGSPAATGSNGVYTPAASSWGGMNFWSEDFPAGSQMDLDSIKAPELHAIVPRITEGRNYNFVMIDSCASAGGSFPDVIGDENYAWRDAFNLGGGEFFQAFFGWNGAMGANNRDDGSTSEWLQWRNRFWDRLLLQATVTQAADFANRNTPRQGLQVNPWDPYRAVIWSDTQLR